MGQLRYDKNLGMGDDEPDDDDFNTFDDDDDFDDDVRSDAGSTESGQLDYTGSPKELADNRLEEFDLSRDDLDEGTSDGEILKAPDANLRDLKMLSLAKSGDFYECIEMIKKTLIASAADDSAWRRLERFEDADPDPSDEDMRTGLAKICFDATMAKRKLQQEERGLRTPPGQLDYSKVKPGINLQPK